MIINIVLRTPQPRNGHRSVYQDTAVSALVAFTFLLSPRNRSHPLYQLGFSVRSLVVSFARKPTLIAMTDKLPPLIAADGPVDDEDDDIFSSTIDVSVYYYFHTYLCQLQWPTDVQKRGVVRNTAVMDRIFKAYVVNDYYRTSAACGMKNCLLPL